MATATRTDSPHRSTAPTPAPLLAHADEPGSGVGTVPARHPVLARCIRSGASLLTVSAFALLVLSRRGALARSLARLGHSHWTWIPVAIGLELTSMAAFAFMQGRLLRAGGKRLGHRPMMATILAANALSVSVPMAGPELGTAFTFRRFKTQGAPTFLASWCLVVGGMISWIGAIVVLVAGGALSGNDLVALIALVAALAIVAAGVVGRRVLTRSELPRKLERALEGLVGKTATLLHHPMEDPNGAIRGWLSDLRSLRLPAGEWGKVLMLGLTNWLADAAVLAISLVAIGA